jgi:TonB family protein
MSISVAVLVVSVWMSVLVLLVPIPMVVAANTVPTPIPASQHQLPSISNVEALTQKAEQGDKASQFELGVLYFEGKQLPQDTEKGLYWLEKSAYQNEAKAQILLAELYFEGKGVAKSNFKATFWLTSAAETGSVKAAFLAATIYASTGDYLRAYIWFAVAERQGHERSQEYRIMMIKHLNHHQLTSAQRWVERTMQKIERYKAQHPQNNIQQLVKNQSSNTVSTEKEDFDFSPYLKDITRRIKESFNPPRRRNSSLKAVVTFNISRTGEVSKLLVLSTSGSKSFDEAGLQAIRDVSPFPAFPKQADKQSIQMEFTFDYIYISE